MRAQRWGQIFDTLYGFVRLTSTEEAIINSPYYQRLRWIKQLGFANYIFDGAEHTRFAHAIGVMHTADQMIRALGKHAPDEKLFDPKAQDAHTLFHKSVRIAALLHDIGTFPFSHSIEGSYIRYGAELKKQGRLPGKQLPNNHEHLGSFIVKNSPFPKGISSILEKDGIDSKLLSKFIKGDAPSLVANQILHSDLDADRLDYLTRDAYYTGIRYGHIDRDYILYHLTTVKKNGEEVMAIKENAIHAVEDFLMARFAWYSQVVKNSSSAKFDILAAHIASHLIEQHLIYRYDELLALAKNDPERFFSFNDMYFMMKVQELYLNQSIKDPVVHEQMQMLLYRIAPRTIRIPEFEPRVLTLDPDGSNSQRKKWIEKIEGRLEEIAHVFKKHGKGTEWVLPDIPSKDIIFTKSAYNLPLLDRDPIKVLSKNHRLTLLIEKENSLLARLSQCVQFIPNLYGNASALELLKRKKIIPNT